MSSFGERMLLQAEQCRLMGSALTGALLEGAAADLKAGGVVAEVVAPYLDLPPGAVPSLRFAGGLHRLVLERKAPQLALHYPSVGGAAPVEEVWLAAERTCREHLPELQRLMARTVQTNEVGRSAVLFGALGMIDGPVRLLEVGASAGLNLRCDHFAYASGDLVLGDPASPVVLQDPWEQPPPVRHHVQVVERRGCDPNPIDPTTTDGRLTLTSYVWADQVARLQRLRGALDVASRVPAPVERAGALEFLTRELARPRDEVTTVVWHSVVWQYVDPAERTAVDQLLQDARQPLVRISLEPEAVDGGYLFRVHATCYPSGRRVHLADALGHGPPVRWTGARIEL
ncbi:MAG: hypothetical protein JWP14_2499 [Frankiales bacterium]|nr:hypothetical protein [Frankiales bacterium]